MFEVKKPTHPNNVIGAGFCCLNEWGGTTVCRLFVDILRYTNICGDDTIEKITNSLKMRKNTARD